MANDTVDLWALDEVHFQQQGSRCRIWVPPETKDPTDAEINPNRLGAVPWAAYCVRCQEAADRQEFDAETVDVLGELMAV